MGYEENKAKIDLAWKRRQKADVIYGIGTALSGIATILIAIGKLRKDG